MKRSAALQNFQNAHEKDIVFTGTEEQGQQKTEDTEAKSVP